MNDEVLASLAGEGPLPPITLSPQQKELCTRLDELYSLFKSKAKPSDMFQGALFAMRIACQNNSDRIAQAAHSLREILYPIYDNADDTVPYKGKAFENYGSVSINNTSMQAVNEIYGELNKLAHHKITASGPDFLNDTLSHFERILLNVTTRQIDLHNEIDQILRSGPEEVIRDKPRS